MQRTSRYRRYQRQKKIAKRLSILRNRVYTNDVRWYLENDKSPWWEEKPGKLDKHNLVCSCYMCAAIKKGNSKDRTPHREKRKYARDKEEARTTKGVKE